MDPTSSSSPGQPPEPTSVQPPAPAPGRPAAHRPGVWQALFITVVALGFIVSAVGVVTAASTA